MFRPRTAAAASLLLIPIVAGGFFLEKAPIHATPRLFDQVLAIVANKYVDSLQGADIYEKAAHPELAFMFKHALTHDVAYESVVAESAHGMSRQPLHAFAWSGVSGASEAPKSTVRAVIAAMPAPEPVGLYETL